MDKHDYQIQLRVNAAAEQAIEGISNVSGWWAREVDGNAKKQGGQFAVRFGKTWEVSACRKLAATEWYGQ